MADVWHVARSTKVCAASGREIPPETPFYSVLSEGENGFERRDYSAEEWENLDKEGFFSYWKNKGYQLNPNRKAAVDYDQLLAFFDRLEADDTQEKRLLRYVLALLLARRRRFRLDGMNADDNGDRLVLWDRRDGGKTIEVAAPGVRQKDIEETQKQLERLFDAELDF